MADDFKRYLVQLTVSPATPERLRTLVPALQDALSDLAASPVQQVFRSVTADVFGYFLKSKYAAGQILAHIESPQRDYLSSGGANFRNPFLTNTDDVLVLELGAGFASGRRLGRLAAWLLHN